MIRKIFLLMAAVLLATLAAAAPAQARGELVSIPPGTGINLADGSMFTLSPALAYSCTAAYMCLYDGASGGGAAYPIPQSWTGCRRVGGGMDNRTSSIYNHTAYNWHVWQIYTTTCQEAGSEYSNITPQSTGNMNAHWNNVITSFERN